MGMEIKIKHAKEGDINAFNDLFQDLRGNLKAYLYRLLTNRETVEDLVHDTFIKGFESFQSFQGELPQFKSWIFSIATRLCLNHLKRSKRWAPNAQDECRENLMTNPTEQKLFVEKVMGSPHSQYEVREHVDFCFTCIQKTLLVEQQVAIVLKHVYAFKVREVAEIMGLSLGKAKHLLLEGRKIMTEIFDRRCALINQNGTCHQCAELQGIFAPKVEFFREANKLKMVREAGSANKKKLFKLRALLARGVDPLDNNGSDLHDHLMQHLKKVNKLE